MSKNPNDISDLSQFARQRGGAMTLPIRSEKVIFTNTDDSAKETEYNAAASEARSKAKNAYSPALGTPSAGPGNSNYLLTAARLTPYAEYVSIRLGGRGGETPGVYNASSAVYKFLINPSDVEVQRQTVDAQVMARSGWQIGVWGEDFIRITLSGKTPGQYFANGLTDVYEAYTASYRNLLALELAFENNGYWFEGEQVLGNKLSLVPRRIKVHQDVQLSVGEFIWSGMFETMETREDADSPFLSSFSLSFLAWKEEFVRNTPYPNLLGGQVERGHVPVPLSTAPVQIVTTQDTDLTQFITEPDTGNWTIS